ncbi:MAG TPA: peroxiredoxin [Acidimicrobiales bacterium]|jgi:thioredoxin-dependent peroxiredoxin|nr:peroxiredoxin [Acidimicrobiales bacterium]HMS89441.1 peroxiredoxin [Acidimicrobiales bacterium]HRA34148.1 peroxiredoxin [Acidimicrobiales bacterium]
MAPSSGDPAPDFELPGVVDGHRSSYRLSELAGHPVVLVFYPGDNTPVCTRQLNAYSTDVARFSELDARILAISPQGLDSHEAFAENEGGFAFPLLADEDKAVGRSYGVLGPMGFYRRCVFVVDGAGRLAYVHRGFAGSTFRRSDELVEAIRAAG